MRPPFARPFFATFFYWYAGISTAIGLAVLLLFPALLQKIIGPELGLLLFSVSGLMIPAILIQGICVAAIGYVIELLAKIEWNTRPDADGTGYVAGPVGRAGSFPTDKQYYLSEKGKVLGPLSAPEMLKLYHEGKASSTAQIAVEENGQRRVLKNWSEVGL